VVGEHPTQTRLPGEDLKPAWRAACTAYRKVRQAGLLDHPAWLAARAAVLEVRPDLDECAAGKEVIAAVHYASVYHTKWLWKGVGDPKYWEAN